MSVFLLQEFSLPSMCLCHGSRRISSGASMFSFKKMPTWNPIESLRLNHPSLVLLEKCSSRNQFKQILAQIMRSNLICETFPMSRLLLFSAVTYPENLDMAMTLFNRFTPNPNLYICNTMISATSSSAGKPFGIYMSMLRFRVNPDRHTLLYLVKSSRSVSELKLVHCHGIVTGLWMFNYLANSFMTHYIQNDELALAQKVFVQMYEPDIVSFNVMIMGCAKKCLFSEAMECYHQMLVSGFLPDKYTVLGLLLCCGQLRISRLLENTRLTKSIHAWINKRISPVSSSDLILYNALIDSYARCKELKLATMVFDALIEKDIFSWNTMIARLVKEGAMESAKEIFRRMPVKDVISWNSVISGCARLGDYEAVRDFLIEMIEEKRVLPNSITMASCLSAIAETGDLDLGKLVHCLVLRMDIGVDAFLGSALIDMYCKCGNTEQAYSVFKEVNEKDVTLWTSMITGLAFNGYGGEALKLFHQMQRKTVPNKVTLVAVLTACSHSGFVDEGIRTFYESKEKYGFEPAIEHYGCLVDLLCRAGRLEEAKEFIKIMPMQPSQSMWGSILSACQAQGDVEMAEKASKELMTLEPEKEGGYILLSNVYAASGRWKYSNQVRLTMESQGVKKTAGCSSVVFNGASHSFMVADKRHPQWAEIMSVLNHIHGDMLEDGGSSNLQLTLD